VEGVEKLPHEVTLHFDTVRICNRPIKNLIFREIIGHELVIALNHVDVVVDPTEDATLNDAVDSDENVFELA
jgi:hypothetical protein